METEEKEGQLVWVRKRHQKKEIMLITNVNLSYRLRRDIFLGYLLYILTWYEISKKKKKIQSWEEDVLIECDYSEGRRLGLGMQ